MAVDIPRRALLAFGLAAPLPLRAQTTPEAWMAGWEAVLRRHVDEQGRVDFVGAAANIGPLDDLVRWAGAVGPRTQPALFPTPAHRIAYHCNTYNMIAMWRVIQAGIPVRFNLLARYQFFFNSAIAVDGGYTTLKQYEDEVIRPIDEERTHFALNCMVRGCPRLPREAFRPERLEAQLTAVTREFCNSAYHVRLDPAERLVRLSEIFRFYKVDFVPGKAPNLIAYTNRWRETPIPTDWRQGFFEYDWSINSQPAARRAGG